jgi:hypothetical protein
MFNNKGWGMLLMMAWEHGWRPLGTLPPAHWSQIEEGTLPDWPRADYVTGRGQRIAAEDAAALADALEGLLDDLPNHDPLEEKAVFRLQVPVYPSLRVVKSEFAVSDYEVFGGENKPGLTRFIALCRKGELVVW